MITTTTALSAAATTTTKNKHSQFLFIQQIFPDLLQIEIANWCRLKANF